MSITPEQLAANRANAQHSTGPATPEGKAVSSQNATKHGLTGSVVVLPTESRNEFHLFRAEVIDSLEPEGPVEREFAQIVANSQWRLRRVKSIEDGMLATGSAFGPCDPFADPSTFDDAETIARVFVDNARAFSNLSHYEHRLYRTMTNALKQLKDLQSARKKQDEAVEVKANHLFNMWRFNSPSPFGNPEPDPPPAEPQKANGFVFPAAKNSPLSDLTSEDFDPRDKESDPESIAA